MKTLGIDVKKDLFLFVIVENGVEVQKGTFKSTMEIEDRVVLDKIEPENVYIDSGYRSWEVYLLCKKNGYTATKGMSVKERHKKHLTVKGSVDLLLIYFPEKHGGQGKDLFCDARVLAFAAFT